MALLDSFLIVAVLGAVAAGIAKLIDSDAYQANRKWYKSPIAFLLGAIAACFFPSLVISLYWFAAYFYGYSEGLINTILLLMGEAIGFGGSILAGIFVYYSLCNKTKLGVWAGYALYALVAIGCAINVHYEFVYTLNIWKGALWIAAIAVGLVGTIKLSGNVSAEKSLMA